MLGRIGWFRSLRGLGSCHILRNWMYDGTNYLLTPGGFNNWKSEDVVCMFSRRRLNIHTTSSLFLDGASVYDSHSNCHPGNAGECAAKTNFSIRRLSCGSASSQSAP